MEKDVSISGNFPKFENLKNGSRKELHKKNEKK